MTQTSIMAMSALYLNLDLKDTTSGKGHDKHLGHGQQLCEKVSSLSRSNKTVKSYDPDTDFPYVCIVTLTFEI